MIFFPRASERRVLPIVGVCKTSSHLHISSSHPLIFTSAHLHILSSSHLLIFTPSHLHICSSSHLLIFTSSYLHTCSPSLSCLFLSFSLKAEGGAGGESRNVNPFARNEGRSAKTEVKVRFDLSRSNSFVRMRVDRQKLR